MTLKFKRVLARFITVPLNLFPIVNVEYIVLFLAWKLFNSDNSYNVFFRDSHFCRETKNWTCSILKWWYYLTLSLSHSVRSLFTFRKFFLSKFVLFLPATSYWKWLPEPILAPSVPLAVGSICKAPNSNISEIKYILSTL